MRVAPASHRAKRAFSTEIAARAAGTSVQRPGCLDDRAPAVDLALDQLGKALLAASRAGRNVAAEVEQPLARRRIVQRLVERGTELVEGRLRCPLGREQRVPGGRLELGHAGLLRRRYIGERR